MTGGGAMYTPPEYGYGSAQHSRQPEAQRMRDSGPLLIVRPPKDRIRMYVVPSNLSGTIM